MPAAAPRQGLRGRPGRVQVTGVRGNRSGVVLLLLFISGFRSMIALPRTGGHRRRGASAISNSQFGVLLRSGRSPTLQILGMTFGFNDGGTTSVSSGV